MAVAARPREAAGGGAANSSDDITLACDAVGNLTDDGTYDDVYDAFGRLRQVKNQSNQLVEENWYNGLGYRIVVHNDVDGTAARPVHGVTAREQGGTPRPMQRR